MINHNPQEVTTEYRNPRALNATDDGCRGRGEGSMERSDMIAAGGPQGSAGRVAGALSNRSSLTL